MGRDLLQSLPPLDGGAHALLEFVWDNGVDGMLFIGEDHKVLAANPIICLWLGRTEAELREMTWMDFTVRDDINKDIVAVREVLSGMRDTYSVVKHYAPVEEAPFPARLTVTAWRDTDGKRVLMFYSQIQKVDKEMLRIESDVEVIWRTMMTYKKTTLATILGIAAMGEGIMYSLERLAQWATTVLPNVGS